MIIFYCRWHAGVSGRRSGPDEGSAASFQPSMNVSMAVMTSLTLVNLNAAVNGLT